MYRSTVLLVLAVLSFHWKHGAARVLNQLFNEARNRIPIVITPGTSGSIQDVFVENQKFISNCPPSANYTILSPRDPLPQNVTPLCANSYLRLFERHERDSRDVRVTSRGWGSPDCANHVQLGTHLFPELLRAGYKPGVDLHVACWDSRLTPDRETEFYSPEGSPMNFVTALSQAVEDLFVRSGGQRVLLVGYSNGFLYNSYAVSQQPEEWVRKYIGGLVSIAGNVAGAPGGILGLLTGSDFLGLNSTLRAEAIKQALRSFPLPYASLPDAEAFGNHPYIKVEASNRTYTALDYPQLFRDLNITDSATEAVERFLGASSVPCVPVVALVADTPASTLATLLIARNMTIVPVNLTSGDGLLTSENTQTFLKLQKERQSRRAQCSQSVQVVDVGSLLGVPLNHSTIVRSPPAVQFLVEEVLQQWDDAAGCVAEKRGMWIECRDLSVRRGKTGK